MLSRSEGQEPGSLPIGSQTLAAQYSHMFFDDRPLVLRCAVPVLAVAAASLFASLLPVRLDPSHFTLYFLAVMLSSWYSGFIGGVIATIASALVLDYYFVSPTHAIELDWHAFVRVAVFLVVAMITNILTSARRRAEAGLLQARAELEDRVRDRTAELASANVVLRQEIAERQRIEKELLRLQHDIGQVERLATLGKLTATFAHDLGTPLNSVLGYAQLLAQDELPERSRRRLSIIETQIHRMVDIIQSYLAHSRGTPAQKEINVNELISDTLLLLQPVFDQHHVRVSTELDATAPIIYGDSNSIQRVLINLLDNAVDACSNRGNITITSSAASAAGRRGKGVMIELADTGVGIAPEILPNVFDLFVTTKEPGKGSGLGLVICQEILKAHGGTINIASKTGSGTTVTLLFPNHPNATIAPEERDEIAPVDSR
jgi:signal transduction histidine kinase